MVTLDELLIKIGVDGTQAQKINGFINLLQNGADKIAANAEAINNKIDSMLDGTAKAADQASQNLNKVADSADNTGNKIGALKVTVAALVAGIALFGNKIASAFNSAIGNAEALFKSKNALYDISKEEIAQVDQYQRSLDKTALSINSIKTKIAINLIPAITAINEKFNNWLMVNKDFITNGITKVVSWLGKGIQVVTNFIKFIDKAVTSTIGWKKAFIALGAAWAVLNRKFLMSPVGILVAALAGMLLLIDDLMVYMNGGQSLIGSYWDPLINGTKSIIEWFNSLSETTQNILGVGGIIGVAILSLGSTALKVGGLFIKAFKMMGAAVKILTSAIVSNPIMAILAAIATAAYLIYNNWDWLSTQFKKIWENISKFATKAWDTIVSTVSDAIKDVLMYFGMTEGEANTTIEAIKKSFEKVLGYITAPFEAAVNFVKDLFKIWGDDNTSFTDKVGKTFSKVTDLIKAPFQAAMKWIDDTFMKHIRGALGWVEDALSAVGFDVDLTGKEANKPPPQDFARHFVNAGLIDPNDKAEKEKRLYDFARSIGVTEEGGATNNTSNNTSNSTSNVSNVNNYNQASAVIVPPPYNTNNQTVNNNQAYKTAINIHTTDTVDGVKRGLDSMERQIEKLEIGSTTSFGSV